MTNAQLERRVARAMLGCRDLEQCLQVIGAVLEEILSHYPMRQQIAREWCDFLLENLDQQPGKNEPRH